VQFQQVITMADKYKLTEAVEGFSEGDVLEVASRYGADHVYDVRLVSARPTETGSVELTTEELSEVAEPVEVKAGA